VRHHILILAAVVFLAACDRSPTGGGGGKAQGGRGGSAQTLRVAVVPKGTTHEFWKAVEGGARQAAQEPAGAGKVEVTFRGPEKEDDREQQVALVQNLISAKFDAICLAPLDDRALVGPVREATAAGIPVVIIDSGLQGEVGKDFIAFVATDNYAGGQMAGHRLGQIMGGQGKALLLRYQEGSASTDLRERGFLDGIKSFPDVEVVDPRRYAGPTRATAQEAAENLLAANPQIDGVFCPNESSTFGMLLALRSRNLAGSVRFVGFDSSPAMVQALTKGEIDALVLQNPTRMGYLGVKTAVEHLRGRPPASPTIDTGVFLLDAANLDSKEAKALLGGAVGPEAEASEAGGPEGADPHPDPQGR
jgi:ribose transport system substrate-binding protein